MELSNGLEESLMKKQIQMRRGVLELCVLSIIAEGEVYPSDIIEKLKEFKLIIKEGTLYPLLSRLKKGGLLHYTWKESVQGPPRKYFHITNEGATFLNGLMETWNDLVQAVDQTTKNINQQ